MPPTCHRMGCDGIKHSGSFATRWLDVHTEFIVATQQVFRATVPGSDFRCYSAANLLAGPRYTSVRHALTIGILISPGTEFHGKVAFR